MLSAQKRDTWKMILLFFMPAVFVWLTTMVIPFLYGIFISFLQWDGIGNNYEFIGLENYIKIFSTPRFMETLGRTAVYTIGTVVLSNILGIALGLLLTSALKGRNLFRTAIFVPNVIGGVAMGYIWKYIFHYGFTAVGVAPTALRKTVRLTFDRPFVCGVVDLERGLPLFLGTFEKP